MFGLFGKKKLQPAIRQEYKDWIEGNMMWFVEHFGFDAVRKPFITPTAENFPYTDLRNPDQFQKLFEQMCGYWDLDHDIILVKFFDDITSRKWSTWVWSETNTEPIGLYYKTYSADDKPHAIELALSNFADYQRLITVMAHELAHVKLLGGGLVQPSDIDMEEFTDLAVIYFAFGIFIANSVQRVDMGAISRVGYLPIEMIAYANALLCYITQQAPDAYVPLLNRNTNELFRKNFKFLVKTADTKLNRERTSELIRLNMIEDQIYKGWVKRDPGAIIEGCKVLLERRPTNPALHNSIGGAILMQKRYLEAIPHFTKAIECAAYWYCAFYNRGYCNLQLGNLEEAYADLSTALDMNPDDSFCWRNMGAYYLQLNELDKALQYFCTAEKIAPKTQLINSYLGTVYLRMNNAEQAKVYFDKSARHNEYNDSMIV